MPPRRKQQFFAILGVMVLASIAEVFSLSMIVPFLAVLVDPSSVSIVPVLGDVVSAYEPKNLILFLGVVFCGATVLSAVVRMLMLYAVTKFTFLLGADFSLEVYRKALYQPYIVHIYRNSSEVTDSVLSKANAVASNVIAQILNIASAAILSCGVLLALLTVNVAITVASIVGFVVIYATILSASRQFISRQSRVVAREGPRAHKALQEGLGGIRDVIIDGTQEAFVNTFRLADRRLRVAQAGIQMAGTSPRFLVESVGMILIVIIAIATTSDGASGGVVAVLGALALGAQRLLPVIQQAYAAVVTIRGSEALLEDVLSILEQPFATESLSTGPVVSFQRQLEFSSVDFAYSANSPLVLQDAGFVVKRGARVGIFGPTGGGKSTLLDIIMGLLEPTAGQMTVDDIVVTDANRGSWQRHIAHVPQHIFLSDASVMENIAFGHPAESIDRERVKAAARLAQVSDVIDKLPQGYETLVGERGTRLSGGQRQRLGIARALYKQADLIIFDEATSALDSQTEADLMAAIEGLSKELTIIMVAHRMSTLRNCDVLFEVAGGRVSVVEPTEVFGP